MLDAQSLPLTLSSDETLTAIEGTSVQHGNDTPSLMELGLTELLAAARRVLASVNGGAVANPDACLRAELREARELFLALGVALEATESEGIAIAEDGTWFQLGGPKIDMGRRGAVRRILLALAQTRASQPGVTLSVNDLFQLGWPGEKIPYESQVRRVYTAVWTLRTLGLDSCLLTRNEGYLLDPKKPLRLI